MEDPAAVEGSEEIQRKAFQRACRELDARIKIFTSLRLDLLDRMALQERLEDIGRSSFDNVEMFPGGSR